MDYLVPTTAYRKRVPLFITTIFLLALGLTGCTDSPVSPPQESNQSVEEAQADQDQEGKGVTALESARNGGLGGPAMGQAANDLSISATEWTDPDSLPAFYCVSNTAQVGVREGYATTAIALHFPSEMVAEADGQKMKFRYRIYRVGEAGKIDGYRPEDQDVISRSYCLMPAGPQVLELMRRFIDQSLADRFGETYGFIAPKPEPGAKAGVAAPALPGLMNCVLCDGDGGGGDSGFGGGGDSGDGGGNSGFGGGGPVYDGGSMGTVVVTAPRYHGPREEVPPLDDVPPPPDFSDEDVFGDNHSHWGHGGRGGGSSSNNNPGDNSNRNEDNCRGSAAAVTPISSVMTPDGEGPLYDGPSTPTDPCEDGPKDDENEEEEENNIEIDPSDLKNHPKANCVYKKISRTKSMEKTISAFAGENTNYNLKIEVRSMTAFPDALGGATKNPNQNNELTITINQDYLSGNASLDVAQTFLHEGIHAELNRKVASAGGIKNVNKLNFPGIYDYYRRYVKGWSHQQMAEHYRDVIVDGMREYDNNKHSDQFYNDLAWRGLENTTSWDQEVSPSDERRISHNYKNLLNESGSKQCN